MLLGLYASADVDIDTDIHKIIDIAGIDIHARIDIAIAAKVLSPPDTGWTESNLPPVKAE